VYSIYVIVCDHRTFTQFDIEEPTLFFQERNYLYH